ncbi:MAG: isoaspartyl peptidase/L-asparaginase [Planctomycetaceae bacterium]|nr:MAG: isoaspartyl peptidase/L-asparaginase [Planctomycetaceae bacterium]
MIVPFFVGLAVPSATLAQTATTADVATSSDVDDEAKPPTKPAWAIAVHGGAGSISGKMTPQREAVYHAVLRRALAAGTLVLADGGSAVDAVEEAVRCLEDDPLFNAGRGAVATIEGTFELDASIMDGNGLRAGGVAGIRVASNPISVARRVMDTTGHVLLGGPQADQFAVAQGFGSVSQEYFFTPKRFEDIQQRRAKAGLPPLENPTTRASQGTVGAVARDADGNLAAATSTGGRSGKLSGRIGDSPIAGAGNYAENGVVAVSGTGIGEEFIRHSAAAQVAWFIKHADLSVDEATRRVIHDVLRPDDGGMISLGPVGPPIWQFSTKMMSRGMATADGQIVTQVGSEP